VCEHNRLKCTNNVFYCLDCGAVVQQEDKPEEKPEEKPVKRARKKKTDD